MTIFDPMLDYHGNILGDVAVAFLMTCATVASVWNLTIRGHSAGNWLVTIGFGTHAFRLWFTLVRGGDPPISPIGLVCLGMISVGWCLIAFKSRHAVKRVDSPRGDLAGAAS